MKEMKSCKKKEDTTKREIFSVVGHFSTFWTAISWSPTTAIQNGFLFFYTWDFIICFCPMKYYAVPKNSFLLLKFNFVLLMKSHLQSYPCPLQINSFWNLGFLLGITIILQIITGIFLGLHYTSDLNSAYSSVFFFIREIYYGWYLRYLHSSGASFVFLFLLLHLGRAISYGSYF